MRLALLMTAAMVAGCATTQTVWDKPNSSENEFQMDAGQCKAQAFGVPGAQMMQVTLVYVSCMQGKGWRQIELPAR